MNSMPIKAFEFLVQKGWNINSPIHGSTITALCLRTVLDSFPLVKWFIENGADPNLGPDSLLEGMNGDSGVVPNSGRVLNHAACTNPTTAVSLIKYLVDHGLRLENGCPLHYVSRELPYDPECKKYRQPELTDQWQQEVLGNKDPLDFSTSASTSRIPVIKYLLELGFDPNAYEKTRLGPHGIGSPLHYAIYGTSIENARFLLENDADPWSKNYLGQNTLEAARYGQNVRREAAMHSILRQYM